jgi:tetratricopeptide (TPR) repeat protein
VTAVKIIMSRSLSVSWFVLPLFGSCAWFGGSGNQTGAVGDAVVGREPAVVMAPSVPVDAAAVAPAAQPAATPSTQGDELPAFWRDPSYRQRLAESYFAEGDVEPKPPTAGERATLQEVADAMGNDKADDAIRLLQRQQGPAVTAVIDFTLGTLHMQREQLAEAAAAYVIATTKVTRFRRAWKNLGLVQVRLGAHTDAARSLTRVIELGGADALTFGLLGFALSNADDHLAAESAYRMATMLDPATMDWRLGLARSLFRQRRHADAAALCATMIALHPDRTDLWLLQANAYVGMNELRKAAENYEVVDRLGQSSAESLYMLGDIYTNEALPDLASNAYVRAIGRDHKGDPSRALRAAKALAARGAHGECKLVVDALEQTLGSKLDDVAKKDVLKLRARLAVASGAGEEEARVLEQLVALDPLDGEAILLLGQYHQRRGEPERAVLQFERAAGIAAFEADAKVQHAQLLVKQARYAEALPLLRRAQQLKPRDPIQQFLDQVEKAAQGK